MARHLSRRTRETRAKSDHEKMRCAGGILEVHTVVPAYRRRSSCGRFGFDRLPLPDEAKDASLRSNFDASCFFDKDPRHCSARRKIENT